MTIIGGVESARVGPHLLNIGDTVDITMGSVTRTSVIGLNGVAGQAEVKKAGRMEMEVFDDGQVAVDALLALLSTTVTITTKDAGTFVLRNAAQVDDVVISQADGKYTIVFEGPGKVRQF